MLWCWSPVVARHPFGGSARLGLRPPLGEVTPWCERVRSQGYIRFCVSCASCFSRLKVCRFQYSFSFCKDWIRLSMKRIRSSFPASLDAGLQSWIDVCMMGWGMSRSDIAAPVAVLNQKKGLGCPEDVWHMAAQWARKRHCHGSGTRTCSPP